MSPYILDTDTISLLRAGDVSVTTRVLAVPQDGLAITVISVEEMFSGWYTLLRQAKTDRQRAATYDRIASTLRLAGRFQILSFSETAMERYGPAVVEEDRASHS